MKKYNKKNLQFAEAFRPLLTDLRWAAHNPNVIGAEPGAVMTAHKDGWEFGCKVEDLGVTMRRKVFVRCMDQPLNTVPKSDKDPILNVVMDEMLDRGQPATSIEAIAPDCVMIVQDFIPLLLEKRPSAKTHIKFDDSLLLDQGRMVH